MSSIYRNPQQLAAAVVYTAAEQALVNTLHGSVLTHDQIWKEDISSLGLEGKDRDALKVKIKTELQTLQENYCVYCGFHFTYRCGEKGTRSIQRDHIAPKYKYKTFTFTNNNLVLACYHCNNDYKGKKDTISEHNNDYDKCKFKIIHPYKDVWSQHLELQNDGTIVVVGKSDKGHNTKEMFGLDEKRLVDWRALSILFDTYKVDSVADLHIKVMTQKNRQRKR